MSFVRYHPLQICPRSSSRCTTRRPFQSSRGSSSTGGDAAWHRSSVIAFDNVDKLLGGGLGGRFFILPPYVLIHPRRPFLLSLPYLYQAT
ncbi:hypothetical protein FIBSPDRAFT_329979 [Athelia psychrophila]|uniref:Uncharacterized protein n=1 Tax=Athelia psychrophila TaxID=1759441 RepID=A0A167WJX2_9AGAM|nr:hypothetical protein FIBSPDRAFT_329979 [Fibularhizoctonia sp. CBS 109695]